MDIKILQADNGFIIEIYEPEKYGNSVRASIVGKKKKIVCLSPEQVLEEVGKYIGSISPYRWIKDGQTKSSD